MRVLNTDRLDRKLRKLAADNPRIASQALRRTGQRISTRVRRSIARHNALPVRLLKDRVRYFTVKRAGNASPMVKVWVGLRKSYKIAELPGARFDLRRSRLKAGKIESLVFKAKMPSGHRGLFARKAGASHYKRGVLRVRPDGQRTELPIIEPRVTLDRAQAERALAEFTDEQVREFLPSELRRLLQRQVRRG